MSKNEDSDHLSKLDKNDENFSAFSDSDYVRGEHPNSLKNLKPFPKGVSGNPLGRPHKYQKLADRLNSIGGEEVCDWLNKPMGHTYRQGVLKKIWEKANQGDIKFIQLLAYLGCLDEK
jgi:hypothetical protein